MNIPRTHQQGFTLIEVMVALALMALLSMISWRALDSVERSNDYLLAHTGDSLDLVRALEQLDMDVAHHAGNDILPSQPSWDPAATVGALLPPGIKWDGSQLWLVRAAQHGRWQNVMWRVADGGLQRHVGPASQTLPLPAARDHERLLTVVTDLSARVWMPGQGWTDPAQGAATGRSATGLEISITREIDGKPEVYRKVMSLP